MHTLHSLRHQQRLGLGSLLLSHVLTLRGLSQSALIDAPRGILRVLAWNRERHMPPSRYGTKVRPLRCHPARENTMVLYIEW